MEKKRGLTGMKYRGKEMQEAFFSLNLTSASCFGVKLPGGEKKFYFPTLLIYL